MMKRKYSIFAVFILLVVAACGESKYVLQSPDGSLSVKVGQSQNRGNDTGKRLSDGACGPGNR